MTVSRFAMRFAILPLLAVAVTPAVAAQPAPAPPAQFAGHPYTNALGAVWSYRSCGVRANAARYRALEATVQAGEVAARAKGLGPELDRVRAQYNAILAVSTMMACPRGPVMALREARRAVAAFRAWVAAHPPAAH